MHTFFPSSNRPSFIALLLFLLLALCLFSCRTKKTVVDKQEQSVSLIDQKDVMIKKKEQITTSTLNLNGTKNWSITPVDTNNPSKVVYKGDTLQILNAKIEVGKTQSETRSVTSESRELDIKDESTRKIDSESFSKKKDQKLKTASWGLNLGIIVGIVVLIIVGFIHLRLK